MKKIIIIGATSGIGRALAHLYASRGNLVGVTGRRQELLYSLQLEYPNSVITQCFDAAATDNITHLQSLIEKMGGLDLLIYNAGFGLVTENVDTTIDQTTVRTNVKGFMDIISFGIHFFTSQGHGHLVTTSSVAANRGSSYAPAYNASKAFQSIYFEGLHMKFRKLQLPIYVTDIQPGFVDTQMAKSPRKFWVSTPEKAAQQMFLAIEQRKWRVFITHRWRLIAWLMQWIPGFLYRRIG